MLSLLFCLETLINALLVISLSPLQFVQIIFGTIRAQEHEFFSVNVSNVSSVSILVVVWKIIGPVSTPEST